MTSWLRRCMVMSLALAASLFIDGAAVAADLPAGYWPLAQSQALLDKVRRARLAPDLTQLTAGERAALGKLVEAGRIIETLFERQLHPQAGHALVELRALDQKLGSPPDTQNLLALYRLFAGPIAELPDYSRVAFLPVDAVQPGKNLYPWKIAKAEIDAWLVAHPDQRGAILGVRTVVRRAEPATLAEDGLRLAANRPLALLHPGLARQLARLAPVPDTKTLYAIPYSLAYAEEILHVFSLLNEAADAVAVDDAEFAGYLRNRARDFLSDDYESGDAAWMTGQFRNLNAEIGAYETYDDELFAAKATFAMSLLLERKAETAAVREALKGLQAFEDSLPYTPHKQVRNDIPVTIYDVIADFGGARGSNTATILPNDPLLARRYGRRILIRSNILRNPERVARAQQRWAAVVAPAHRPDYDSDGEFYDTLWHEIGHYLGVDRTADGRDPHDALEEDGDTLEEMKADLVSLFVAEGLQRQGYYDAAKLRSHYAAGIYRVLLDAKPRRDDAYGTMQLMQWNFFMEQGLLTFDPASGTVAVNYAAYHDTIAKLLAKVLELQRRGDKAAADQFITQYTAWDDNRHGVVARKLRDNESYHYSLYGYGVVDE